METKKFYEQPEAEVVEVKVSQILCASPGGDEDEGEEQEIF